MGVMMKGDFMSINHIGEKHSISDKECFLEKNNI